MRPGNAPSGRSLPRGGKNYPVVIRSSHHIGFGFVLPDLNFGVILLAFGVDATDNLGAHQNEAVQDQDRFFTKGFAGLERFSHVQEGAGVSLSFLILAYEVFAPGFAECQ